MKVRLGDLRKIIREAHAIQELGGRRAVTFDSTLDLLQKVFWDAIKTSERAHELAPEGAAKAIVAGIHSDLFNQAAEIRKYVERLKAMTKASDMDNQPYR